MLLYAAEINFEKQKVVGRSVFFFKENAQLVVKAP